MLISIMEQVMHIVVLCHIIQSEFFDIKIPIFVALYSKWNGRALRHINRKKTFKDLERLHPCD